MSFIKGCLSSKVFIHQIKGHVTSKESSIKGCLPSKAVFKGHLPFFIKGCLPTKLSSIKGHLPSKVVFHQRSFSNTGCLPSMVIFHSKFVSLFTLEVSLKSSYCNIDLPRSAGVWTPKCSWTSQGQLVIVSYPKSVHRPTRVSWSVPLDLITIIQN